VEIQTTEPNEIVVMQSDSVLDSENNFIDSQAYFYIILSGEFKVTGLKFNKRQKKKENEERFKKQQLALNMASSKIKGLTSMFKRSLTLTIP